MSRSATCPTSSSRRRWSSSRLSRDDSVTVWLRRPPKALTSARSRPDQARPWRATTSACPGSTGRPRVYAGERGDFTLAAEETDDPLAYVGQGLLGARSGPGLGIEAGDRIVEAADDFNDLRARHDLRYRLDDETCLQAGNAGRCFAEICHSEPPPRGFVRHVCFSPTHIPLHKYYTGLPPREVTWQYLATTSFQPFSYHFELSAEQLGER